MAEALDTTADKTSTTTTTTEATPSATAPSVPEVSKNVYPPSLREDVIVDGKLTKRVFVEGSGDCPPNGCEVEVHYTGRLLDGTVFDSSSKRNEPFKFKLGRSQVIKGWDSGVATMKRGEKALLICHPEYAYGASGSPPSIPANATLEFEVELLSFNEYQNVDGSDGLIKKKIVKEGTGYTYPNDSSTVHVKITAKVLRSNEDTKSFIDDQSEEGMEYILGEDPSASVGFDLSLKSMKQGEHSIFKFVNDDRMGYSGDWTSKYSLQKGDQVEFDLQLVSFKKARETWEMNFEEKVAHMGRLKEIGNAFFKAGKLETAYNRYKSAVDLFQYEKDLSGDKLKQVNAVRVPSLTNQTIVKFKEKNYIKVIEKANEALGFDPDNVKCLFKRGQAYTFTEQFDLAERDFKRCLEIDPNNVEIKKENAALKAKVRAALEKERKTFGGWFNKVQLVSDEELAAAQMKKAEKMDESSEDEFDENAKPSPMPTDGEKVANTPLPVEDGPHEMSDESPTPQKVESAEKPVETQS